MPITPIDLPDDPRELRALLIASRADIAARDDALSEAQEALAERDREIEALKVQLATLQRLKFGRSSEKLSVAIEQLALRLEELESDQVATEFVSAPSSAPALERRARKPARRPLPTSLPRESVLHSPISGSCNCPDCGGALRRIGESISELLEYVPARFKVIRHVRPKFACAGCETLVQVPAVSRPIAKGLAGPGLLAHVLVSKYADHLPLYRQAAIYAREGVDLERSTLADWVGRTSRLLRPLGEALSRHVTAGSKIHADDTPVPVLSPGAGKTKTGRLWAYVRDDRPAGDAVPPAVWFKYSPDRRGCHPQTHLKGYTGILQTDAYAGFNTLYAQGATEAGCWAHVRRKFYDIQQANASPLAAEALQRISALYAIEATIRGRPPDKRREIRQARAGPRLADLHTWLEATLTQVSTKSALAVAIRYALTRWPALVRYVDDGRIEIDNNAVERAIRAVALGRKNYLFAGSDAGGERAALMYSLIGTAKLNGLDPQRYLSTVIERIAEHPVNRVEELLPWNLVAELTAEPTAQAA